MKKEELIERGLSHDSTGKIFDEYNNEYRNENGEVEYIEESQKDTEKLPDKLTLQQMKDFVANLNNKELYILLGVVEDEINLSNNAIKEGFENES